MSGERHIRALSRAELKSVYKAHLTAYFPANERKPLHMIEAALDRGEYETLGLFDGAVCVGFAFFVRLGDDYLLDYYAVNRELRGTGLGSAYLQMLRAQYRDAHAVIIEAEEIEPELAEQTRKERERRIAFYLRNGCTDSAVTAKVFGVTYRLLTMQALPAETVRAVYARLYQSFLPKLSYRIHVHIQ